ncbi:uncharacterized protein LOC135373642 [Ornithodoros turicata]|uniref:uncharacterized protein LOC135373642 n=1 Tax=Ornithodoros turicata TaxID=34597 RepID=UPI003139AB36
MVILVIAARTWMLFKQDSGDIHHRVPSTTPNVIHGTSTTTQDTTTPKLTRSTTTTTITRRPLTDEELTKLAETRPITVLFVGDHSYSTISKEQFLIYAQSQLNMINAAFAENNIKLKMKVYDTYVLNEEQERNHLVEIPGRQFQSIDSERTSERLKGRIVEYPGVNESDIVYVFTRKLLSREGSQQTSWDWYEDKTGPCGGRLLPNIYYDPPFSYLAVTHCMWSNTLVRIVNTSECDDMHLDQCYQHLIPAYKDDLNRSLCYTTTDTQNAPTFSGVVGFNVDNFCKASALIDGLTAGKGSTVSKSCTTPCGVSGHSYDTNFFGPCKAPQSPGQACFDDDDALCFLKKCGKKYSEIKALSRRNWNLPDSHYDEMDACAKYP